MIRYLNTQLKLNLRPNKMYIKTLSSGLDFLDWVHFPDRRVLRTSTKRRMFKNLAVNKSPRTLASYLGLLKHGNTQKIQSKIKEQCYT